jgi:transmembrane sensor
MTEPRERLFKAWADAMARTRPELDPHLRQRVLAEHAKRARPSAFPLGYRWALGGFAVAVAVAVAVLLMVRAPAAPSFQVAGRGGAGDVGAWLTAEPGRPLPLLFSEGTRVLLGQGSRARVSGVARGGARIELASGGVDADVAHLPGANWTFGAGPFEVTVTGTHLGLSWAPDAGKFELSVSQGSVLVRGPFIQGEQEVRAGQICRVDMTRRLMELGHLGAEPARPERTPPEATPPPRTSEPKPEAADAGAPVTSSSGAPRAVSADAWLEAARAARLAGRPDEERAALLACRRRAPGQAAAAQAAYLLGRASSAAEAAQWFETYLREQPQGLLAREAAGRLIESYRASGNTGAAQTAAARYLARYPHGPHASLARQALTSRSEGRE